MSSKAIVTIILCVLIASSFLLYKYGGVEALENEPDTKRLIYIPIGDSLAEGWHATTKDKSYISILSQFIQKGLGYNVITKNGVRVAGAGLKDAAMPNISKIIMEHPDLITIEFGTNDSNRNKKAYVPPEEFKMLLWHLVERLQQAPSNPKIILVTTWNRGQDSLKYDHIIKAVAEERDIAVANIQNVWMNRTDTCGPDKLVTYNGLSDNWHPNDKGHQEIAEIIFEQAKKLLKEQN
ncbi:SGNH/GDSL hydrolase family protein [Radiobacillus kanasensis]|uniref:SGNH/GDSL hydrolase family protein n=1 Tax=Radiobacillus kanasensis TaxID=2844358 RepID=UPI001E2E8C4F|nr:SGNH/GDSL hydrolase family protein [Radiobacillus kanasensis]UFT98863.1 SGNH/GDSL hydrolase family protein [Radiobacillus kanasensis]